MDNLLPNFVAAVAAPICLIQRIRHPDMVSFGLLANLSKMNARGIISGIDSIWDVGANHGQFAFMAHNVWPNLPIYSFEPDPDSYERLEYNFKKFSFVGKTFCCALGEKIESRQLYRYDNNVNNSLLENDNYTEGAIGTREVECTTLDAVSEGIYEVNSAFLKLDVQGFELMVLNGATSFLKKCLFLQIEVSFSPAYSKAAHAGEIILEMDKFGFDCIDILDLLRDKSSANKIIEADLLFKKRR
ncbi:MAG: FkbM family methyltransferase [Porticoccaceae bacterium]